MKVLHYLIAALTGVLFGIAQAGPLHIGFGTTYNYGPCWYDYGAHRQMSVLFNLPLTIGSGEMDSGSRTVINPPPPAGPPIYRQLFFYRLALSGMSEVENHCITLSIRFGSPLSCDFDFDGVSDQVLMLTNGPGVRLVSANQTGDVINFAFESNCLHPGQTSVDFALMSDHEPTTNQVTVVDVQSVAGTTNIVNRTVRAIVPRVPLAFGVPIDPRFQGQLRHLYTNSLLNGLFNFRLTLYDADKFGQPASETIIQTAQVTDGLFTVPLSFDSTAFHEKPRWLNVEVRPEGNGNFTALTPMLPIAPAPQSIFAISAGSVSSLSPGQAVTLLNGLTDEIALQAGAGILIETQKNTLIISTKQQPSPLVPAQADSLATRNLGQKLDNEIKWREAENAELKRRIENLEKMLEQKK